MNRPSTSTNPLFIEQDDDMSSYVTKSHLFCTQRALHQEQQAMNERIDNLATDLRLSEQRTRDYFDNKLDAHKQENDARMDEILAVATRPQMVKSLCSGVIPGSVMLTPHSTSKDLKHSSNHTLITSNVSKENLLQ